VQRYVCRCGRLWKYRELKEKKGLNVLEGAASLLSVTGRWKAAAQQAAVRAR
jgi:hypothetical protein